MKQVQLQRPKDKRNLAYWYRSAPPFVQNKLALLIHRVRYIAGYNLHQYAHIAVGYWCGNHSTDSGDKLKLIATPPKDHIVCATCERAARRGGQPSSTNMVGRPVRIGRARDYKKLCCKVKK